MARKNGSTLGPRDIELVILPRTFAKKPARALARPCWNDATLAQFERKRDLALQENDEEELSVRVDLTEGGSTAFLFIDPKAATFQLHSGIREAFGEIAETLARDAAAPAIAVDVAEMGRENQERLISAVCILFETAAWKPVLFGKRHEKDRKRKKEQGSPEFHVITSLSKPASDEIVRRAFLLGQANNWVRTLAVLPTNELDPARYRKWIERFCKDHRISYEFWDRKELTKQNAGAFLAVLRADPETAGGIMRIHYKPKRAKAKKIVLVGKGLSFDTGGYNVKVGDAMYGMHNDMTGSAVALALCGMYAELKADFEVIAYLALAENLISPTAYKPNEVVLASNGLSVEVIDTDAEGRMVLADTLALASREKPELMLDFATLTYAAMRSLDTRRSAVFSNKKRMLELAIRSGESSGERTWGFPIGEDYRKELESKIADIRQCAPGNLADHIYAATFLSEFVDGSIPWVHVDLSSAEHKGGLGLIGSDTSGFGILFSDFLIREVL